MSISENVNDGKRAKIAADTLIALMESEAATLPSDRSRERFWSILRDACKERLPQHTNTMPSDVILVAGNLDAEDPVPVAESIIDEIRSEVENVSPALCDFAESVVETASGIGQTIERTGHVTDRQMEALRNMLEGLVRATNKH